MLLVFVINPKSGQLDLPQVSAVIERIMTEAGREFRIRMPDKGATLSSVASDAVDEACQHDGAVVAVGGDGTMNTVAQHAVARGCRFGLLPQGTFNYFSRANGLDLELEQGVRALLDARVVPVQVGIVNQQVFLVNAAVGLYPAVLQDRETYKKQWGRYRWVAMLAAALTILRHDSQLRLTVVVPGVKPREIRTPTLFVGNNSLQLERLGLPHAERLQQNQMAAVTLKPSSRITLLWLLLRGAFGKLGDADNIFSLAFSQMIVGTRRRRRIRVAIDGEVINLHTPLEFAVSPKPLLLLCPRDPDRNAPGKEGGT